MIRKWKTARVFCLGGIFYKWISNKTARIFLKSGQSQQEVYQVFLTFLAFFSFTSGAKPCALILRLSHPPCK